MTRALRVEAEPAFRTEHANPYNACLYRAMQGDGVQVRDLSYARLAFRRVDIVHLHWPNLTFLSGHRRSIMLARLVLFYSALRIARLRGTRMMWTVHNIVPHEEHGSPWVRRLGERMLFRNIDGIFCLSEEGIRVAKDAYPELRSLPAYFTPHGHYREVYDFSISRERARQMLGIDQDARLTVCVGQLRPYKNAAALVGVFRRAARDRDVLLVAGKPASAGVRKEIEDAAEDDPRVRLELGFVADARLALILRAADLVALPYRAIQNSGSAILALSAGRAVVVPDIGAMNELAALMGPDWVHLYSGEFDDDALIDALQWAEFRRVTQPDLAPLEWPVIASATERAYREVLAAPRMPSRSRLRRPSADLPLPPVASPDPAGDTGLADPRRTPVAPQSVSRSHHDTVPVPESTTR